MKRKLSSSKIILSAGVAATLAISGFLLSNNIALNEALTHEKIVAESNLSEKLLLDKKYNNLKISHNNISDDNKRLKKTLADKTNTIGLKDNEIKRLNGVINSSKIKQNKINTLTALNEKISKENKQLQDQIEDLRSECKILGESLLAAEQQNHTLIMNNSVLKAMIADNYRTEALKGKHSNPTVVARKADKLKVSFVLPEEFSSDISFLLITPDGKEFSSRTDACASIKTTSCNNQLYASTNTEATQLGSNRVEMEYKPKSKMKKGIYQFNVYCNNKYIGATELRLR